MASRGRWLLVGMLSLAVVDVAAQGDAGKRDDAGADWQSAIRVVPVKDERVRNGRMAAWQGTLGAGDTVDVFRTPALGRDQFVSILVVPGPGASAVYSVTVTDRAGGRVFIERSQVSGKQNLDVEVTGEVAIRLETAATTAFEYGVALMVAPPPRHPLLDLEVKNPGVKPPAGFSFVTPSKAGSMGRSADAPRTTRLVIYAGALLSMIGLGALLLGRRRSRANRQPDVI